MMAGGAHLLNSQSTPASMVGLELASFLRFTHGPRREPISA